MTHTTAISSGASYVAQGQEARGIAASGCAHPCVSRLARRVSELSVLHRTELPPRVLNKIEWPWEARRRREEPFLRPLALDETQRAFDSPKNRPAIYIAPVGVTVLMFKGLFRVLI
jgi:hypothetical protein